MLASFLPDPSTLPHLSLLLLFVTYTTSISFAWVDKMAWTAGRMHSAPFHRTAHDARVA